MENQYKIILRSKIESAVAQAMAVKGVSHKVLKGKILEILIKDLFRPLLPSDIGVGTGQIIEWYNKRLSNQQDIILYDKSILPPILFESDSGIFPIESVLYTIEVKTTLNASGLRSSHEAAKQLNNFCYLPGLKNGYCNEKHHRIEKVRSVMFALNSDLSGTGKNEVERYREIYKDDYPYLGAICVIGREYWFEKKGSWVKLQASEKYDEVLGFIGGVMNTYKKVADSRHEPYLGNYIIDIVPIELITIPSGTETVVNVYCDKCGNKAILSLGNTKLILNTKEGFNLSQPCKCGGFFKSSGGKYKVVNGELIKVGEYQEVENS